MNIEMRPGGLYLHDDEALTYLDVLNRLEAAALSAPESLAMLRKRLEEV